MDAEKIIGRAEAKIDKYIFDVYRYETITSDLLDEIRREVQMKLFELLTEKEKDFLGLSDLLDVEVVTNADEKIFGGFSIIFPWDSFPCQHGRSSYKMCPHCMGF